MANEEQLSILKQGSKAWNEWRSRSHGVEIDLRGASLRRANLSQIQLGKADLTEVDLLDTTLNGAFLRGANLTHAYLGGAILDGADLGEANLFTARLRGASLKESELSGANLSRADLSRANICKANLVAANLQGAVLAGSDLSQAWTGNTIFANLDLSMTLGLEYVSHLSPSVISMDLFSLSKGNIPEAFLRGCGLSDADIEYSKLSNPELENDDRTRILYKIYDLRAKQAIQISPLFISYSHDDGPFVDKLESYLNKTGIRFWRDVHDATAGPLEKQIDRAIRQNPTLLLILSSKSIKSDWVRHEVRIARELEKEKERHVLCPVALDSSWKSSAWPKRIMEQVMEYNVLDFSKWNDDIRFDITFNKLVDGLELFYKG